MLPKMVQKELDHRMGSKFRVTQIRESGLSNAIVYRVDSDAGVFALKCWPPLTSLERAQSIHDFQRSLFSPQWPLVPRLITWADGSTLLDCGSTYWELSEWKPGEPVENINMISDGQLWSAVDSIVKLHECGIAYGSQFRVPPGVVERIERLTHYLDSPQTEIDRYIARMDSHELSMSMRKIQDTFRRRGPAARETLRKIAVPTRCFWVMRDLWREHVLYHEETVVGIIDFGAARIDTPLLDLARFLGSVLLPDDFRWKMAMSLYNTAESLDSISYAQVRDIDFASTLVSGIHWLDWLASNQLSITDRGGRPAKRLAEIAARLIRE